VSLWKGLTTARLRRDALIRRYELRHDFEDVRASLNGMLPAEVYEEYYRIARYRSHASILELGTGQGAGAVAFALGVKDSGRSARVIAIDQFSQSVQGPHPASRRTHGDDTVPLNLRAFEEGLRKYRVHDCVDIHVGKTVDLDVNPASCGEVDVLAIDVDGMLDRDLYLFYDHVSSGGLLILDDYADTINAHGRKALDRYLKMDQDKAVTEIGRLSSFHRRRLLGKHLLTYRLVERFEALGLLSKERVIGSTLFCRKPGDASFPDRWTTAEGDAIEQSIVDDFLRLLREGDKGECVAESFRHRLRRRLLRWVGRG
jgi:hypothetical protein